ncbi:MAG: gamma-glutamylcyclotransferase [Devosia sp.]
MRLTPELVARVMPYTGEYRPQANVKTPDEHYDKLVDAVLARLPVDGRLWIFAFGSLMWKPGPEFGDRRPGTIRGWHRAFCLGWDRAWRGNPVNPTLMLSLDRGGQCRGVALEVRSDEPGLRANLLAILKREPPIPTRWVKVDTADGQLSGIAFTNDRKGPIYVGGLTEEEIAEAISKASGKLGSMAEYLRNTIEHLATLGIHDSHLWRMQELVAERLEQLPAVNA